jgi:hypothetical protein
MQVMNQIHDHGFTLCILLGEYDKQLMGQSMGGVSVDGFAVSGIFDNKLFLFKKLKFLSHGGSVRRLYTSFCERFLQV